MSTSKTYENMATTSTPCAFPVNLQPELESPLGTSGAKDAFHHAAKAYVATERLDQVERLVESVGGKAAHFIPKTVASVVSYYWYGTGRSMTSDTSIPSAEHEKQPSDANAPPPSDARRNKHNANFPLAVLSSLVIAPAAFTFSFMSRPLDVRLRVFAVLTMMYSLLAVVEPTSPSGPIEAPETVPATSVTPPEPIPPHVAQHEPETAPAVAPPEAVPATPPPEPTPAPVAQPEPEAAPAVAPPEAAPATPPPEPTPPPAAQPELEPEAAPVAVVMPSSEPGPASEPSALVTSQGESEGDDAEHSSSAEVPSESAPVPMINPPAPTLHQDGDGVKETRQDLTVAQEPDVAVHDNETGGNTKNGEMGNSDEPPVDPTSNSNSSPEAPSTQTRPVTPPKVTPYHPAELHPLNASYSPTFSSPPPAATSPSHHNPSPSQSLREKAYSYGHFRRRTASTASQGSGSGSVHGRRKVGFLDKIRGEAKVIIGKIENKKEMVERGKRILHGED